jgi:hypothetical protein
MLMNGYTLPLILNLIVKSALSLLMKLDDDNLAVKTTLICSAVEQPPIDSGRKATSSSTSPPQHQFQELVHELMNAHNLFASMKFL